MVLENSLCNKLFSTHYMSLVGSLGIPFDLFLYITCDCMLCSFNKVSENLDFQMNNVYLG